ncbi:MAG TPA: hypothetical protein VF698_07465 [Thermoanaerobaculia bacterium]|jgi:hypothetical protein
MTRGLATIAIALVGLYAISTGLSSATLIGVAPPVVLLLGAAWLLFGAILIAKRIALGRWFAPETESPDTTAAVAAIRLVGLLAIFWSLQAFNSALFFLVMPVPNRVSNAQLAIGGVLQLLVALLFLTRAGAIARWILGTDAQFDRVAYEGYIAIGAAVIALFLLAQHGAGLVISAISAMNANPPTFANRFIGTGLVTNFVLSVFAMAMFAGRHRIARL